MRGKPANGSLSQDASHPTRNLCQDLNPGTLARAFLKLANSRQNVQKIAVRRPKRCKQPSPSGFEATTASGFEGGRLVRIERVTIKSNPNTLLGKDLINLADYYLLLYSGQKLAARKCHICVYNSCHEFFCQNSA